MNPSAATKRTSAPNQLPKKWIVILLGLALVYALAQPLVNRQFGWQLPSLQSLLSKDRAPAPPDNRTPADDATAPLYGVLRDVGREVYVSPAGLRYTRGSEEGHRLKHLERHLNDQPDRSGRHGVFTGNMPQVLQWIDDGYTRARRNEPGTRQRQEQGRTVFEAEFPQSIGYVGGREGNRRGRPATKQLRVVTEEDRVITAFPF